MKRQMTSSEIIRVAAKIQSPELPFEEVYKKVAAEINLPGTQFFRQGNTLFIIHPTDKPGVGFFRALNADDGRSYLDNCVEFTKAAYALGFDTLFTQFKDPSLINIFRYVGRNKPADMGYKVEETANGEYQVTVQVGPRRNWS
jgi:hypothetical protein